MFDNSITLTKFIIKRDFVRLIATLFVITAVVVGMAFAFSIFYSSPAERELLAVYSREMISIFMSGPGYGLELGALTDSMNATYSMGAIVAQNILWMAAIVVSAVNIFWVIRHTRTDEELGRLEVIRSLPVGKLSSLAATFMSVGVMNVLLALMIGIGLAMLGIEEMNLVGSLFFGSSLAATGMVFASIAAFCTQLSKNARTVLICSLSFLGVSYLVRGIGDVLNETVARLSPLGLMLRTQPYVNNEGWPLLLLLFMVIVIGGVSLYLNGIRDLGSGLLMTRPGKDRGGVLLRTNLGLAFKLTRGVMIVFWIVLFMMGLSFGSTVYEGAEEGLLQLEIFQEMREELEEESGNMSSAIEHTTVFLIEMFPLIATIPSLSIVLKVIQEEKRGRIDHLLSRALSREKFLLHYLVIAIITSTIGVFLAMIGFYISTSIGLDEPFTFGRLLGAGMVHLPAIWFFISLTVILIGYFPRFTIFSWLSYGIIFLHTYFWGLLRLPIWTRNFVPFSYFTWSMVDGIDVISLILMTAISLILTIIGFKGYQKRDIKD